MNSRFDATRLISALEQIAGQLPSIVRSCPDDDARWRPPSGNWSILEIVCHLADEECEDFRKRIQLTWENPRQSWPGIDPEQWARDRNYNQLSLAESVDRFVSERRNSIEWLASLENPDWNVAYHHEKLGNIRAGDLLSAWSAHDRLHLRQIVKRQFEMIERDAGDFSTAYAGNWTA